MSKLIAVLMLGMAGCGKANISPHWYVEPADDFKWRACVDGGCGSPMEFGQALWWVRTKGGTVDGHLTKPK